jgi:uncharacterized RDD family membrane protein YckC
MSARSQLADVVSAQGHYAGAVSRLLAYLIDAAVSTALFALGLGATSLAVQVITGHSVHWTRANIAVAIIFALWEFFYFGYSWAASGRTFGMAVLGVRVVAVDGTALAPWRGALRALVFPLSFLLFGLGFLGILVQREHRALHDLIAGSVVIYAWDARQRRHDRGGPRDRRRDGSARPGRRAAARGSRTGRPGQPGHRQRQRRRRRRGRGSRG